MECKIPGREPVEAAQHPLDYGLEGLNPGAKMWYYKRAQKTIERVMMDPASPPMLKQLIREQNAVGLVILEQLLAAHHKFENDNNDGL